MPSPDAVEAALGWLGCENDDDGPVAKPPQASPSRSPVLKPDLLTPTDAVSYCNVSRSQFFEWVRHGYVDKIKRGRYVRYSIKDLDEMLRSFKQKAVRVPRHKRRIRRTMLP
jgi:hypothetical protein